MPQSAKNVVSLAERGQEKVSAEPMLLAEAFVKSDPSPEARAYVDAMLESDPEAWRKRGDLAAEALDLAFKDFWLGYITKASVQYRAEMLKRELGHAEASAAERVLIEHAVVCHVRLGMTEHLYSRNTSGSYDIKHAEHFERRLTLAQKRFTRAITALAKVRALLARADAARDAAERARERRGVATLRQAG